MIDPAQEQACHGHVDHGLGDIDPLFVVAHRPSPRGEPAEGSFDGPATRRHLEAGLVVDAPDDFDGEVEEGRPVHEPGRVIGAAGEQVLDPGPVLAHGVETQLTAGAVGDSRRAEIDHRQATVGVHGSMPVVPERLLGGVAAALRPGVRGLTVSLSTTPTLGLAKRPTRAPSIIKAKTCIARNKVSRTKRRNHQCTACQGGMSLGNMRRPPPELQMVPFTRFAIVLQKLWLRDNETTPRPLPAISSDLFSGHRAATYASETLTFKVDGDTRSRSSETCRYHSCLQ